MGLKNLFSRRDDGRARSLDEAGALAAADELVAQGRALEAVDLLAEVNRRARGAAIEARLVRLRREAVDALTPVGRTPWPPIQPDPFPDVVGCTPEVARRGLTAEVLGGAVLHHGCLVVRGLFDGAQVARTLESVGRASARRDAFLASAPDGFAPDEWYRPFPTGETKDEVQRRRVAGNGGTWLADSPAATAQVLDDLVASGAIAAVAEHFGDRPLFSLQKSTLRCSPPVNAITGWHQDGSFLGDGARAMNIWVALSACGGDLPTPALELVPRRVPDIMPTDGGLGSASIAEASVARVAGDTPPIHPQFAAGDAIMFDERFVHRTYLTPGMRDARYALECWLFAPTFAAEPYTSLVV